MASETARFLYFGEMPFEVAAWYPENGMAWIKGGQTEHSEDEERDRLEQALKKVSEEPFPLQMLFP